MSRTSSLKGFPLIESGINRGRLDRPKAAKMLAWSSSQLSKAYNNWIQVFRKEGSTLNFIDYIQKMNEAKITPDDLGNSLENYHLCRVNDEGGYHMDNCSFKTKRENRDEQKTQRNSMGQYA